MEIVCRNQERCLEIRLLGELDHHGAREIMGPIDRAIEQALPLQLLLDWSAVSFMDSSGIAVIMRARQRMRELGGSVKLCHVPPQAGRVLEAAGISRYVSME